MKVLRKGMKDRRGEDEITQWQYFLRGLDLYKGPVDGDFGKGTDAATIKFQKQYRLSADGVVGNRTYAKAFELGFNPLEDDDDDKFSQNWPPKPDFKPINSIRRVKLFGEIEYESAGTKRNPEAIRITNNWQKENLVRVKVPQLIGVYGAPKSGRIYWHRDGVDQLLGLFEAWEDAGFTRNKILGWAGSWVPRFVRGSRRTLSNHSWATAIDINVPWNGLGRMPALVGNKGSVREMVPIANDFGFYWGGFFKRQDGMHFELAKKW